MDSQKELELRVKKKGKEKEKKAQQNIQKGKTNLIKNTIKWRKIIETNKWAYKFCS